MLVELRRALDGPGSAAAIETLRHRFRVALIDEFQDTDPVQWDIFRTIFPMVGGSVVGGSGVSDAEVGPSGAGRPVVGPHRTLVLVGDPKQAIYAFRGANVHTYLSAVDESSGTTRRSLGTNWRSDGAVVDATAVLLRGRDLRRRADRVHRGRRCARSPGAADQSTSDGAALPAVSLRLAIGDDIELTKGGDVSIPDARAAIISDLVERLRDLLDHARLPADHPDGAPVGVLPSDIAVLVRSNKDAEAVRDALRDQGIPAVLSRGGSVLDSAAADQWRWLLDALSRPSDPARVRTFALSWFGGRSPDWAATAGDDELIALADQLASMGRTARHRGVHRAPTTDLGRVGRHRTCVGATRR